VQVIARHLNDYVVQMPARLAEADAQRWSERGRRERWRMAVGLLAMLLGGFLAGQVASYRSGGTVNVKQPSVEETASATKSAPSAPRRRATKPSAVVR